MISLNTKFRFLCSFNVILLAIFWTAGLICGICYARNTQQVVVLMRLAFLQQVSIVGLLYVLYLPLLIAIISIYHQKSIVFYILIALKSFLLACSLYWIADIYGQAAWLVQNLLLFSEASANILLLLIGTTQAYGTLDLHKHSLYIAVIALLIGAFDYLFLSPFSVTLLN